MGWYSFAKRTKVSCYDLTFKPKRIESIVKIKYRVIPAGDDRSMGKTEAKAIKGLTTRDSISLLPGIF